MIQGGNNGIYDFGQKINYSNDVFHIVKAGSMVETWRYFLFS
jgi:hypothetical protein